MITSSPSREQQISNAQSRLLAPLDGATPAAVADAPSSKCPKCHAPDFHSGTWCGDCGYFPKAGFEGDGPAIQEVEAGELDIWQLIPGWCWLLFAVELTMIVGSFVFSVSIGEHWAAYSRIDLGAGLLRHADAGNACSSVLSHVVGHP